MALLEQGEARWKVMKRPRAILKCFQMVLPFVTAALCIPFKQVGYIHQRKTSNWVNISIIFPFHYDSARTVIYTNETIPPAFKFGEAVEICTWLFIGLMALMFFTAIILLLTYVDFHGGEKMDKVATADAIASTMMAIIGATIGGLWIYNVFNLRKLVRGQLDWVYSTPLVEECIQQKSCIKNYPDFTLLYIAAGLGILLIMLWCISIVVSMRYTTSVRSASHPATTGILEMSADASDFRPRKF